MRRKFSTRVVDETGGLLATNPTIYILKPGANLRNGGTTAIPASNSAVVRVSHPGSLFNGQVVRYVPASGSVTSVMTVNATPVYNAGGWWDVTLFNATGSAISLSSTGRLVSDWQTSANYVNWYDVDTEGTAILGAIAPSAATGELSFFADVVDVDLALTTAGVLDSYREDLSADERLFVTPEEFGAVGDGVADDSIAIQKACDYAKIDTALAVHFPSSYVSTTQATADTATRITGNPPNNLSGGLPRIARGSATPEGSVTATAGSVYFRSNGLLYVKESGTGNTGWDSMPTISNIVTTGAAGSNADLDLGVYKLLFDNSVSFSEGTVDPEASFTAPVGSLYLQSTSGALWVKRTGVGNTGWIQLDDVDTSLPLAGGTMTGDIAMGANDVTGLQYIETAKSTNVATWTKIAGTTLAANKLAVGGGIKVTAYGFALGTTSTKDVRFVFGTTVLLTQTQQIAASQFDWKIEATILVNGASDEQGSVVSWQNGALDVANEAVSAAENTAATIAVEIQGQVANSADAMHCKGFLVEYLGGA